MSRIFQALRQSEKGNGSEAPGLPAANAGSWRELLSSLDSWSRNYEKSKTEAGQRGPRAGVQTAPGLGIFGNLIPPENASPRETTTQLPGGGGEWHGLIAQPESHPEIIERAEHVVCQPRTEERVVSSEQFHSSAQEVFRVLHQRLRRLREQRPLRTILVTSAVPQEGKTVVAINLAAVLARSSPTVLLVDADLRHPGLPVLGLAPGRGLADYLAGRADLAGIVRRADPFGFYYLSAGQASANPAELLQKPILQEFLGLAGAVFDWVILDSPAVRLFADAQLLATLVDGVLLVVREDVTPREGVEHCVAALEGTQLVGVVFNASTDSPHDHYDLAKPSAAASQEEIEPSVGRKQSNGKKSGDD